MSCLLNSWHNVYESWTGNFVKKIVENESIMSSLIHWFCLKDSKLTSSICNPNIVISWNFQLLANKLLNHGLEHFSIFYFSRVGRKFLMSTLDFDIVFLVSCLSLEIELFDPDSWYPGTSHSLLLLGFEVAIFSREVTCFEHLKYDFFFSSPFSCPSKLQLFGPVSYHLMI